MPSPVDSATSSTRRYFFRSPFFRSRSRGIRAIGRELELGGLVLVGRAAAACGLARLALGSVGRDRASVALCELPALLRLGVTLCGVARRDCRPLHAFESRFGPVGAILVPGRELGFESCKRWLPGLILLERMGLELPHGRC